MAKSKKNDVKTEDPKSNKKDKPLCETVTNVVRSRFGIVGDLVVRYLWQCGNVYRYRANWYRNSEMIDSRFVHVSETNDGIVIVDKTGLKQ